MSRPRRTNKPTPRASRIGEQVVPAASASRRQKANAKKAAADVTVVSQMLGVDSTPAETERAQDVVTGPRNAHNTRQNIAHPTLAQMQAVQVKHLPSSNNNSSDRDDSGAAVAPVAPVGRIVHKFDDDFVMASRAFIAATKIAEFTTDRYDATKVKVGRTALVNTFALLVALHLLVREDRPMLITEIRDVLYTRLSPSMQRMLNIETDNRPADPDAAHLWDKRTYDRVNRAFHRFLSTIDPSVLPKNRVRTWEEINALKITRTEEETQERRAALTLVVNSLLETALLQLPAEIRARLTTQGTHGRPAYAIDATPVAAFARGKGVKNTIASTDPDAGFYTRQGDHRDPADTPDTGTGSGTAGRAGKDFKRTTDKYIFGLEAHLMVTADITLGPRQYIPSLPIAVTMDRPGVDPSGNARRLLANLAARGHQPGYLAGDLLYTNQKADQFQIPAREAGYDLVLSYSEAQHGLQETHASGMNLVEGTYYAPCMPKHLVNAVADYRAERIEQPEFAALIKARVQFEMRTKAKADAQGLGERLSCPAAGPNPTAICALKPKSATPRAIRQADGTKADLRPVINHQPVLTNGAAPKVCQQEAISVSRTDGAKYRQPLRFGTIEHTNIYNALRQSQEGIHGSAKDEAKTALASASRRRVRGLAAMEIFVGFVFAEVACRRIHRFLLDARPDENGDLYVPRIIRTGDHATTANPPGATPPPGPEPGTPAPRTEGAA